MKPGKSLVELAREVTRINEVKRDFVVPTEQLRAEVVQEPNPALLTATPEEQPKLPVTVNRVKLGFQGKEKHAFGLNRWSAAQLAGYSDIPKAYFDRIHGENPDLLVDNVNHGLRKLSTRGEARMVRTLDGDIRGLLSSRYRIMDAHDMLETVLPVIADKGMEVVSSEITDQRLFLKVLSPRLTAEVKKGDVVQYGLVISTSDVGAGALRVEPLIHRLICLNGAVMNIAVRKFHVGKNQAEDDIRELLTDSTKALTDAAFWAQVRDVVLGSMKAEIFEAQVDRLRIAANEEIKNFDLPRVVELSMKATGITGEAKKNSIIAALASGNEGAGLTRWGLINSFTKAAHTGPWAYEESVELERAGGQILELPKTAWSEISSTAA